MKRTIYKYLTLCLFSLICSCGKFDINGDLDGMWHLRSVEELTDNTVTSVKDKYIYYSVQQRLITVKQINHPQHIGRFTNTGDSLILHNFRVFQNESIISTAEDLAPFYLDDTTSRYAIKKLNADEMILSSDKRELHFKKF